MPDSRVLIVDDEPGIVKLCERLLVRAGFEVLCHTNPEEGVELLSREQVDLLLVDIRMPELDGFAVIERARRQQPNIAVVIMTGYGTLETAIRALRQGADGLILKPFEEGSELVSTVREALKERRHKSEVARLLAIRPLLDMTETLFSETRYEALLDLILNAMSENMRCEHAGIYRWEGDETKLRLIAGRGRTLPEEGENGEGELVARVAHLKRPLWVNREGPEDAGLRGVLEAHGLGSVIGAPVTRGEAVFVFMAGRDVKEPSFEMADVDMFGILARQAVVALENARLYSEVRETLRQVEESQRALIQAEKMAAVGRLTASIAHEVNNPLQSVRNCLHLAWREELTAEEREDYLEMAEDELERLMATVQRMLEFYRPGALNREPTDINGLLERVLLLMNQQLRQQNVRVERRFAEDLPAVVVVSNQLQQVFWNLILNAMDVMPKGGEIKITTQRNRQNLEVLFEDSGPGVGMEDRESIFEPFTSRRADGTGLGLSVSYGILTAHGGNLELLSSDEGGACFRVSLPLEEN